MQQILSTMTYLWLRKADPAAATVVMGAIATEAIVVTGVVVMDTIPTHRPTTTPVFLSLYPRPLYRS